VPETWALSHYCRIGLQRSQSKLQAYASASAQIPSFTESFIFLRVSPDAFRNLGWTPAISRVHPSLDSRHCLSYTETCTASRTGKWVTAGSRFTVGRLHTYPHNSAQRHAANSPYIRYHLARHTPAMSGQASRRAIAISSCATGWLPPISAEPFAVSREKLELESIPRCGTNDSSWYHRGSSEISGRARVERRNLLLFPSLSLSLLPIRSRILFLFLSFRARRFFALSRLSCRYCPLYLLWYPFFVDRNYLRLLSQITLSFSLSLSFSLAAAVMSVRRVQTRIWLDLERTMSFLECATIACL